MFNQLSKVPSPFRAACAGIPPTNFFSKPRFAIWKSGSATCFCHLPLYHNARHLIVTAKAAADADMPGELSLLMSS